MSRAAHQQQLAEAEMRTVDLNCLHRSRSTAKIGPLTWPTLSNVCLIFVILLTTDLCCHLNLAAKDYYYTRLRDNPNHLRVAEEFKNKYVHEIKYESLINGTKYEYYKSALTMSHDELVFETIDKIFQHRLSPFYLHHYDNEEDKRNSADPRKTSPESCARDLMYLVDKLPKRSQARDPLTNLDEDHLTPELTAFFDSYARQEAGLLMGNTYWVGAYDQCVNRHIFELTSHRNLEHRPVSAASSAPNRPTLGTDLGMEGKQVVSFKGRYCVSALKSPTWDSIIEAKKKSAKSYFKSKRQFDNYAKLFRLQVGICLPDSCDSSSLERHSDEIKLLTTSALDQRYADYELIDLYCLPDESSPLRAWSGSALTFLIVMALWMSSLLLATLADICELVDTRQPAGQPKTGKRPRFSLAHNLVVWFSLRANYRKLMNVTVEGAEGEEKTSARREGSVKSADETVYQEKDTKASAADAAGSEHASARPPKVNQQPGGEKVKQGDNMKTNEEELKINLRFLNAFKVLIMFWIVNGHIMLLMIQTAKNILYSDALLNGLMHFLIGATFGVDLFFTMTGFLTAYLIFNSGIAYKMRPATWLYLSFHRYWRLAPMYLLTFWLSRSVMQLLGSGPLWDYGTSGLTFRGLCNEESWWYPLTLTSNLHGLFEECMITSWYISCDMQFWLVSPIFIYLLAKNPLHGWVAACASIIMSSKYRYDAILIDQSARYDELVQPRADIFMRVSHDLPALYTHPHYRIAAYLVGLLAGHYVYMIKSRKWSSSISSSLAAAAAATTTSEPAKALEGNANRRRSFIAHLGLFFFLVMSFISYLLSNYYPSSWLRYAKLFSAIAYSMDHLVMSIGASLMIIAMCFGQWPNFVSFLSHPNWTRLSKINYALLLLQCEAIYFQIFRYEQVPVAGTRELVNILFNLLVTLYPLAFVVTLAFEFPLANIEKLLI